MNHSIQTCKPRNFFFVRYKVFSFWTQNRSGCKNNPELNAQYTFFVIFFMFLSIWVGFSRTTCIGLTALPVGEKSIQIERNIMKMTEKVYCAFNWGLFLHPVLFWVQKEKILYLTKKKSCEGLHAWMLLLKQLYRSDF